MSNKENDIKDIFCGDSKKCMVISIFDNNNNDLSECEMRVNAYKIVIKLINDELLFIKSYYESMVSSEIKKINEELKNEYKDNVNKYIHCIDDDISYQQWMLKSSNEDSERIFEEKKAKIIAKYDNFYRKRMDKVLGLSKEKIEGFEKIFLGNEDFVYGNYDLYGDCDDE